MTKAKLMKATVKELRNVAKMMGLKGYSKMRKAALVEFILSNVVEETPAHEENVQLTINFEEEIIRACNELNSELPNRMGYHLMWMLRTKLYRNIARKYDDQINAAIRALTCKGILQSQNYEPGILTDEQRSMCYYDPDRPDDKHYVHMFYFAA